MPFADLHDKDFRDNVSVINIPGQCLKTANKKVLDQVSILKQTTNQLNSL